MICPASVLHNWRREADRFTPHLKVLVLESGAARHNLRKQIPQHDFIVTNYALLRRDLEELQKFAFRAVILDEAQFIKNPGAQVTQSVKQLKSEHRLALTGTPLENRLLDLWSIVDFVQPGYLGNQEQFLETYEPRGGERRIRAAHRAPAAFGQAAPAAAAPLEEARRQGFARPHRATPRLRARRRAAETLSRRTAPQPRPGHADRRGAGPQQKQDARPRRAHAVAADLLPSATRRQRHRLRQDRDAVRIARPARGRRPESAGLQPVRADAANCSRRNASARNIPTHMLTGQTKDRQEVVSAFQNDTERRACSC